MPDDVPRLRLVDPDERAPEPEVPADVIDAPVDAPVEEPPERASWMSAVLPVCIGVAVLAVGLAFSLKLLMDPGGDEDPADSTATVADGPATTFDPASILPGLVTTTVPDTTAPPTAPTVPPTTAAPAGEPGLVQLPVVGGAAPPAVATPAPATTGTVRVRIFNGYRVGTAIEVWNVAGGTPVRYGTVPYAGLVEMVAGGKLLPGGVALNLRFVLPGGDPQAPRSASSGPWSWNFTPPDGSSQTLAVSDNEGFRVLPIDNVRALGAVKPGQVHVVPVVFHLLLEGTRTKRWAADGVGCLGPLTTDNAELDVPVGTALRMTSADDPTCTADVSGPVVVAPSTAVAVVGIELPGDRAQLVALPLG